MYSTHLDGYSTYDNLGGWQTVKVTLLVATLVLGCGVAHAQQANTYPGVILSSRSTAANEALVHTAAAQVKFTGLASEPLASGTEYVKEKKLSALESGLISGRRKLCRTARIRKIMKLAKGYLHCSPNYELSLLLEPNDPSYNTAMWGLFNIAASAAWDVTTGSKDAIVAVVDTGIFHAHPDLRSNIWSNPAEILGNGRDDDVNGYIDDAFGVDAITRAGSGTDDNGHGTHVAGTIGATGNNGLGVVGVNWNVRLMAAKFLNSSGSGSTSDAIRAIEYIVAAKKRGHNVVAINASWGGGSFSEALLKSIENANQAGILFVASAGNSTRNNDLTPSYPASYRATNVVSVASIDSSGQLSYFSNYGLNSVHIAAPGGNIYSTVLPDRYGYKSGTSMAAPHVAGIASLSYAACPLLNTQRLKDTILGNGLKTAYLSSRVITGSMANAAGAILAAKALCSTITPSPSATPDPKVTVPPTPTPTATSTPTSTPTAPTPTPTSTPTATPTPTNTPLPTNGYLVADPSTIPAATTATLRISTGQKNTRAVVSLKYVVYDTAGSPFTCPGATIVSLPTGTRTIKIPLPAQAKHFPAINISFATLRSRFTTTLYQTGTKPTLVPRTEASRLCRYLTSKHFF
jgi:subtilisin family serine protease